MQIVLGYTIIGVHGGITIVQMRTVFSISHLIEYLKVSVVSITPRCHCLIPAMRSIAVLHTVTGVSHVSRCNTLQSFASLVASHTQLAIAPTARSIIYEIQTILYSTCYPKTRRNNNCFQCHTRVTSGRWYATCGLGCPLLISYCKAAT